MPVRVSLYQRYFLGKRDLLLLWIGQVASGFGDSLISIGFIFLALDLTNSETAVGLFQTIAYVPIVLFGLAAGVYVDRRDRKRVMLAADGGRALVLAGIPLLAVLGGLNLTMAGIAVMAVTTLTAFFNPAYNSALPLIVDEPASLFGVNAVMQSSRQFASMAGPMFAAFGSGRRGPATLLGANAVTYIISFTAIYFIAAPLASGDRSRITFDHLKQEVAAGLRTVMGNRSVRAVFLLTLINNLLLMGPAFVGTPLLVKRVFGGTIGNYAIVELMYAVGMTITGVLLHRFPTMRSLGRLWAYGLVFDGLTFVLYLWADTLPLLYLFTFIHALAIPMIIVSRATIVQRLVPQHVLGRAFGYIDIAVLGVAALSAGITGVVCTLIGPRLTIVYGGALAGIVGLVALTFRSVRNVRFDDTAG
ncbi:MAG TPA: MFS transporter [Candidatus Kapabacteria bacterium]|nr:MFS transporter [Candidatus Kapabacteria bacterium]